MGLRLPGELERLLNDLGYIWPEIDEDKLLRLGATWMNIAGTAAQQAGAADRHAQGVWTQNKGKAIDAFEQAWRAKAAPSNNLRQASAGAMVAGAGMMGAAAIVLGLKISVTVQLTVLAVEIIEALATAPETFGASLLEIPVFKEITGKIIGAIINEGINALMSA